jgi:cell wall-associated NlpC family hydrolase
MAQQGKRYVFGASGPATYDCSGLVLAAYAQIGITLYHYTGVMITKGRAVVSSDLQRGDLIFPSYNHVQIYLGNGKVLHASSGQGKVVVANLGTYIAARRLV